MKKTEAVIDIRTPFAHLSDEDLEKAWKEYRTFGNGAGWHPGIIQGIIQQLKRDYERITIGMQHSIPALVMPEMIKRYRSKLGISD
ncbi:hypothetical protein PUW24_06100 [Paenibacillus urinalis]|uniref:Uncharacterized protein n=1 Tax=Paenibacillus urinalis TaxID=521520 RepID=A0AAX3MYJ4_9BACL|nr:hypothetical protein [Paenibacillus urinalis]WDH82438.1 hypothetical protein PUW23_23830 [Paenibacillus urinalis]WDH98495.1 hypothetical protein PUW24_06100 [Paenibacillus urinalis]WDI02186.1 hypothetical protein PUW25_23825 [Paenibacillus urinalis]